MRYWYDKDLKVSLCEPNCAKEWLRTLWAVGYGYDGHENAEDLKKLIDELIEYAGKALDCINEKKLVPEDVLDESENSLKQMQKDREEDNES